jgi:hypothetical protein
MEWKNIVDRQAKTGAFFTESDDTLHWGRSLPNGTAPPTQSTRLKNGFIHNLFTDKVKKTIDGIHSIINIFFLLLSINIFFYINLEFKNCNSKETTNTVSSIGKT